MRLFGHDSLLYNALRWRREISISASCSRCDEIWEDSLHIFRDCSKAREIWCMLSPQLQVNSIFALNLKDWLEENLKLRARGGEEIGWLEQMVLTRWALWKWRNSEVFEGVVLPSELKFQFLLRSFEDAG